MHQFYTDALLKNPEGKVFSPIDFSIQQTVTGLLLSYIMEMGVEPTLVVEANNTLPTEIHFLSDDKLRSYKVEFDPHKYSAWKIEAYHNGIVAFSQTQSAKTQMTIYCRTGGRTELLITYTLPPEARRYFIDAFHQITNFYLLGIKIPQATISVKGTSTGIVMHVPLNSLHLSALEKLKDKNESFGVNFFENKMYFSLVHENISLEGLASSIRLIKRNCIE